MHKLTREEVEHRVAEYNRLYFDGVLPSCKVSVARLNCLGTYCHWRDSRGRKRRRITIATNVDWTDETLRAVILHEMIHCYVRTIDGCEGVDGFSWHGLFGHGRRFRRQCKRIKEQYGIDVPLFNSGVYRTDEKMPTTRWGKMMHYLSLWLAN